MNYTEEENARTAHVVRQDTRGHSIGALHIGLEGKSMNSKTYAALLAASCLVPAAAVAQQEPVAGNGALERAGNAGGLVAQMTLGEKISLLSTSFALPGFGAPPPAPVPPLAAYRDGIERLGIPSQRLENAALGVGDFGSQRGAANGNSAGDPATALPSGLTMAATFDREMLNRAGDVIGSELRDKRLNVGLGGGVNLARDPRGGRNFEYLGEDPHLAGELVGELIDGAQGNGVAMTIKHYALNNYETLRMTQDVVIDLDAARESDLLAFQKGIEIGRPASAMCSYNAVNGTQACNNDILMDGILKDEWGFDGWVMSDFSAASGTENLVAGLDQQSAWQADRVHYLGSELRAAVESGAISEAEVDDAAARVVGGLLRSGADWDVETGRIPADYEANAQTALEIAQAGIVLLKNDGALPLVKDADSIAVIGGNADFGVLSGAGSSQVIPTNGEPQTFGEGNDETGANATQVYFPSSPVEALDAAVSGIVGYDDGTDLDAAVAAAADAEVAIVFATKWFGEADGDAADISLPGNQDALIAAVAARNPNTIVVLETGNPVAMPWLDDVKGVVEAFYPGQEGGQAIADILTGAVNPSGRLPMTFTRGNGLAPIPGFGEPSGTPSTIVYEKGSEVGYRDLYDDADDVLFAFGHGLSYTQFDHRNVRVGGNGTADDVAISLDVANTGDRDGADVPQAYLVTRGGEDIRRLVGYDRLEIASGETARATFEVDPRLLADAQGGVWVVAPGTYGFAAGKSAMDLGETQEITLRGSHTGTGSIAGDVTTAGLIAPGNAAGSDPTGEIAFEDDLTFDPFGVLELDFAGAESGLFDRLSVGGDLGLFDTTLEISAVDGFEFATGQYFDILDVGGNLSGTFAGLDEGGLVEGFGTELFITYAAGDGNDIALFTEGYELAPIPLPATGLLLGGALAGLGALRHRRRR